MALGDLESSLGLGFDRIENRLRLREIETTMQESPLGKLAWLSQSSSRGNTGFAYMGQHQSAPMAVKFYYIFSGK
jgi:hypothetical protein